MPFENHYDNLVTDKPQAHTRLIRDYDGSNPDFNFIVIGSGMGGGILADDLADSLGDSKRILVIDAGSFIYPTHVYNISRYPNSAVAKHFGVVNFKQDTQQSHYQYIGEEPQMNLGGRSIFWSGLIPTLQDWEKDFFPGDVRNDLENSYLEAAGVKMNESITMGAFAEKVVDLFERSDLANDFSIKQTPRAVHQPYLYANGKPGGKYFIEPTGVFNTAELIVNQTGLTSGKNLDGNGLYVKLNAYVEAVKDTPDGWHEVVITDTATQSQRSFYAPKVIIAAGSTESPKLINRSDVYQRLSSGVRQHVGFGLTDHPVSSEAQIFTRRMVLNRNTASEEALPVERDDHAKIIFYSRGNHDANGHIEYPFNIELNINHEYWHLRHNDSSSGIPDTTPEDRDKIRVDMKFSFANLLDDSNGIFSHYNDGYKPYISFKKWSMHHLLNERFPKIAGWQKDKESFVRYLRETKGRVFNLFDIDEYKKDPFYPDTNWPFGHGTVHHACGTLRMPWKDHRDQVEPNTDDSVVDTNLQVKGAPGLYVCDMSVLPVSTAANPVRTLGGLALRLSKHLQNQ